MSISIASIQDKLQNVAKSGGFETSFADDPIRNKLWEGFLLRSKLGDSVAFPEVMRCIREELLAVFEGL